MYEQKGKNTLVRNRKDRVMDHDSRKTEENFSQDNFQVGFLFADILRYGNDEKK